MRKNDSFKEGIEQEGKRTESKYREELEQNLIEATSTITDLERNIINIQEENNRLKQVVKITKFPREQRILDDEISSAFICLRNKIVRVKDSLEILRENNSSISTEYINRILNEFTEDMDSIIELVKNVEERTNE